NAATVREVIAAVERALQQPASVAYINALQSCAFVTDLLTGTVDYRWAATRLVSDDPAKGLGRQRPHGTLLERLIDTLNIPTRELELISPYLVPTRAGERALAELAGKSAVKVSILTNALESTDVPIVHAGYAKRRRKMLKAGVVLYELMRESRVRSRRDRRLTGSSGSSLHAKTFSVDCARVFVGSFNLDPRSASLNTEMGLVIESPVLAQRIAAAFAEEIPGRSYRVRLNAAGAMEWLEPHENGVIVHKSEPGVSWWKRFAVAVMALLPIEWLLLMRRAAQKGRPGAGPACSRAAYRRRIVRDSQWGQADDDGTGVPGRPRLGAGGSHAAHRGLSHALVARHGRPHAVRAAVLRARDLVLLDGVSTVQESRARRRFLEF